MVPDDAPSASLVRRLGQDLRYAWLSTRSAPGFSAAVIAVMALGIAGTTVTMSGANAIFLRQLPVERPGELYILEEEWSDGAQHTWMAQPTYSLDRFSAYKEGAGSLFEDVGAFRITPVSVRTTTASDAQIRGATVASSNFFRLLGVQPVLGRAFDEVGAGMVEPEVVLGYDFWMRHYGADPGVLGRALVADSRSYTIVGVAPPGFDGPMNGLVSHLYLPASIHAEPGGGAAAGPVRVTIFARLSATASAEAGRHRLEAMARGMGRVDSEATLRRVTLHPMSAVPSVGRGAVVGFVSVLSLMGVLVTAVAATNVAAIFLIRATHRRREVAVKLAVGVGRRRLVVQLLAEALILTVAGTVAGVAVAAGAGALLPSFPTPLAIDAHLDLSLDLGVLAAITVVSCTAGLLAGVAPALQAAREDIVGGLRSITSAEAPSLGRLRTMFVIVQMALSLVLLFTAGLFARAVLRSTTIDSGLDDENVVVASYSLAPHGYDAARAAAFHDRLVSRLRSQPQFESVTFGQYLPLSGSYMGTRVGLPGADERSRLVNYGVADADYFATVGVPILAGRGFTTADDAGGLPVTVVNESLARAFWPDEAAPGQTLTIAGEARTVVGVARDGRVQSLARPPSPFAYFPAPQAPTSAPTLYARYHPDRATAGAAVETIRRALADLDPNVALESPGTLTHRLDVFRAPQRAAAWLVGCFGLVGLLVASVGLFGVLTFEVAQRTRELGLRLAVGAAPSVLLRDVLIRSFRTSGIGVAIGVVAAVFVGSAARPLLYGVQPTDAVVLLLAPLILFSAATLASLAPAFRAARVNPVDSLRVD